MKTANQLYLIVACLAVLTQPAYAYLDPGTGSIIVQGIIGAVAGGLIVVRMYLNKIKALFSRAKSRGAETND
jgi:hypothetical protein